MRVNSRELELRYQGSHDVEEPDEAVRRVVVAVHSSSYQPQEAYNAVRVALAGTDLDTETVCIVAPQILEAAELPATVPDNLLYWNSFPFRGTSSARVGPEAVRVSVSAFEVLDHWLERLADPQLFPHLETIVLLGHSAGGQLVNRYAIAGRYPEELRAGRGVHLRYLVLAPSSYLYFTGERDLDGDGTGDFPIVGAGGVCPDYNDYGYGMEGLYLYPAETGFPQMRAQYRQRFVFYLVGDADNDPDDPSLATNCEAMAQGPDRLERASRYFQHLVAVFGPDLQTRQRLTVLPGVGHSYAGLLNTDEGRRALFDHDSLDTDGDGLGDWAEWIAGSAPDNPASRFQATWQADQDSPLGALIWPVAPGRHYRIWSFLSPSATFHPIDAISPSGQEGWPLPHPGLFAVEPRLE